MQAKFGDVGSNRYRSAEVECLRFSVRRSRHRNDSAFVALRYSPRGVRRKRSMVGAVCSGITPPRPPHSQVKWCVNWPESEILPPTHHPPPTQPHHPQPPPPHPTPHTTPPNLPPVMARRRVAPASAALSSVGRERVWRRRHRGELARARWRWPAATSGSDSPERRSGGCRSGSLRRAFDGISFMRGTDSRRSSTVRRAS